MAMAHRAVEQHREPALLGVIQSVVERLGGADQLLQVGGAGAQERRRAGETVDRVDRGGLIVAFRAPLTPGREAGGALFGEIAHRRFERRPILLVLGAEFEARLQRRNARVEEGGAILRGEAILLLPGIVRRRERCRR